MRKTLGHHERPSSRHSREAALGRHDTDGYAKPVTPTNRYVEAVMKARLAQWWDPRTWLAFMFWELRTIAGAVSNDGLSDWKATATIVIFEILAIVGLTDATSVYLGRRLIDKGSPFVYLVAFA